MSSKATFWNDVDKFLGSGADGASKKDAITGLRTIDSPFHNEDDYRRQGQETLNVILKKAKKDGVRVFSAVSPEYQRVKRIVDRLVDASHYRNHKDKVEYAVIDYVITQSGKFYFPPSAEDAFSRLFFKLQFY